MFLKPMAAAFSGIAWLFGGFFLLVGTVAFAAQKMAASKALAAGTKLVFGGGSPSPERQPLHRAKPGPQGRREPIDIGWGVADPIKPVERVSGLYGEPSVAANNARKESSIEAMAKPSDGSIELIRKIEWKRFEDLCQQFYETKGTRRESQMIAINNRQRTKSETNNDSLQLASFIW
ncbi:MAG: hypothetical protein ACOYNV_27425 [Propionivibrio sp.]